MKQIKSKSPFGAGGLKILNIYGPMIITLNGWLQSKFILIIIIYLFIIYFTLDK